jgi:hypothetical protein
MARAPGANKVIFLSIQLDYIFAQISLVCNFQICFFIEAQQAYCQKLLRKVKGALPSNDADRKAHLMSLLPPRFKF